jgi:trehalose 6-phosphate phosphatase
MRNPLRTEAQAPGPTQVPGALPAPPPLAPACALFLDFDGTLVDLAPRPDEVVVHERLPGLLERVVDFLDGAVAVITGRWLAEVDGLLKLQLPGAGVHGAELREADTARMQVQLRQVPGIGEVVAALRLRFSGDPRVLVEDKGAAVALHYRLAPGRAAECIEALRMLVAQRPGLEAVAGNMVVEARTRGVHKGQALRTLAREPAFAGRTPVFVGDDVSDEDAFVVAAQAGGWGVKVGTAPTVARYRCAGVAQVHGWLESSLGGDHG